MSVKKPAFAFIEAAEVSKFAAGVATKIDNINKALQSLAITCIGYSLKDNNTNPANDAIVHLATKKGIKVQAFVACLEKLGNLKYDSKDKKFTYHKNTSATALTLDNSPESIVAFMEKMAEPDFHWTSFQKDPPVKSMYDFGDELAKFIEKMEKQAKQEGVTISRKGVLDDAKALATKFNVTLKA